MARAKPSSAKIPSNHGRSVNYPFIALEVAITRAGKLWESVGRNTVPLATAAEAWGYAEKSSGVRSTVSALKQYGLLQDIGDRELRQVRLTDRALDIVLESADSARRKDALTAALFAPKIYSEIFDRFHAGLPTQDHAISSFLLRERDFNRKAVAPFIARLRANLQFAHLHTPAPPDAPSDKERERSKPGASGALGSLPSETPGPGFHQDVFALGREGEVLLQWPDKLSQESYNDLLAWIELELNKIARLNGLQRRRTKTSD